jgi:hypothetical protein
MTPKRPVWSLADTAKLREMARQCENGLDSAAIAVIAAAIGRTPGSVNARCKELRLVATRAYVQHEELGPEAPELPPPRAPATKFSTEWRGFLQKGQQS